MKKIKSTLLFSVILLVGCSPTVHQLKIEKNATADIYVLSEATYRNDGAISINVKNTCGLAKTVVSNFASFSKKYNFTVAGKDSSDGDSNILKIEITKLVAGRVGSGFGGRWVVSEMGISAQLNGRKTNEFCSAGLGANPFANFKACDRLERCSKQLGEKLARWISREFN